MNINQTKVIGMRRLWFFAAIFLALISFAYIGKFSQYVSAQTGRGLEISPPLIDKKVTPGKPTSIEIRVRNVTKSRVIAKASVNDFTAQGEGGQPKVITDENADQTPFSIRSWISSVPNLDLAAGEAKTAKITLNVPKDASPGAHFGVIRFTAVAPEAEDSGVALSASIGTLVLANVSGRVKTSAILEEIYTSQSGNKKVLFEYGPVTFTERIKNTGNVYFKPVGNLRIKNMFGKEIANLGVNEKRGNVLPGTIRRFEQSISNKYMFGRYTADLSVLYGDSNQQLSGQLTFWVIPFKLIAITLGLAIVAFFGFRQIGRSYKKRLIKQIDKQNNKK